MCLHKQKKITKMDPQFTLVDTLVINYFSRWSWSVQKQWLLTSYSFPASRLTFVYFYWCILDQRVLFWMSVLSNLHKCDYIFLVCVQPPMWRKYAHITACLSNLLRHFVIYNWLWRLKMESVPTAASITSTFSPIKWVKALPPLNCQELF